MSGNPEGGKQAAETIKAQFGADYYSKIGKKGAAVYKQRQAAGTAVPRGFENPNVGPDGMTGRERARVVGKLGGHLHGKNKANPKS